MNTFRCFLQEVPEVSEKLLEGDRYSFAVLSMIVKGQCAKTITDNQSFVICQSEFPYPVWLWTADDLTDEELEEICQLTLREFPLEQFHYNMKYRSAEWFLSHADVRISTNMKAYECLEVIAPRPIVAGSMQVCRESDLDLLVDWMTAFQNEIEIDKRTREETRTRTLNSVQEKSLYFWIDETGKPVCLCGARETDDGFSRIGPVFTPPEARRHHYAENLVYGVSSQEIARGFTPILYADADYEASNACYQKIGYVCKGSLCTVTKK